MFASSERRFREGRFVKIEHREHACEIRRDTTTHPGPHDWLAVRLTADCPALRTAVFGADAAKDLPAHGHVPPTLDGLNKPLHQPASRC